MTRLVATTALAALLAFPVMAAQPAAGEKLAEDPPAAFVYHYTRVVMVDPRIRGYVTDNFLGTWYAKDIY